MAKTYPINKNDIEILDHCQLQLQKTYENSKFCLKYVKTKQKIMVKTNKTTTKQLHMKINKTPRKREQLKKQQTQKLAVKPKAPWPLSLPDLG